MARALGYSENCGSVLSAALCCLTRRSFTVFNKSLGGNGRDCACTSSAFNAPITWTYAASRPSEYVAASEAVPICANKVCMEVFAEASPMAIVWS